MSKRKLDEFLETPPDPTFFKVPPNRATTVQNSLDSDEEDAEVNEDRYNVMNEEEFEGQYFLTSQRRFPTKINEKHSFSLFICN